MSVSDDGPRDAQPVAADATAVMRWKRRSNELMRQGLRHFQPAEPIPFFCECADPQCHQIVWLTRSEYDARRSEPAGRLVVRAHGDSVEPNPQRPVSESSRGSRGMLRRRR